MLRVNIFVVGLLAAIAAAPDPAQARPPRLGGTIFGLATFPLRLMTGGVRSARSLRARHHRYVRVPPPRRATAGIAAAGIAAAGTTGAGLAAASPSAFQPAGLQFWPAAYDDLLGYVFRASAGDRFWVQGTGAIFGGLFETSGGGREPCRTAQVAAGLALDAIEQAAQSTPEQRPAFDEFRAAVMAASARFSADCTVELPAIPQHRIGAMQDRLWEMRQLVTNMREPLQRLYAVLSDEQKARLAGAGSGEPDRPQAAAPGGCGEATQSPAVWRPIEQALRPAAEQRVAFEGLRMAFAAGSEFLGAFCAKAPPASPAERLDAADSRINALTYTVGIIGSAMDAFYASLNEQQKKRFAGISLRSAAPARALVKLP